LTLAGSAVQVSIINTSTNFVITALLGALVFRENLNGTWWLGAALLVAGSVIIGRREESDTSKVSGDVVEAKGPVSVDGSRAAESSGVGPSHDETSKTSADLRQRR